MATYSYDSDIYTDQAAAKDNSSLMIKDGTKLTGNLQAATARWSNPGEETYGSDTLTITLAELPAGATVIPALSSVITSGGGDFSYTVAIDGSPSTFLSGNEAANSTPSIETEAYCKLTAPTKIIMTLSTEAADLPAAFNFLATIAYVSAS